MFRICCKKRENYGRAVIILVIISLTATVSAMEGEGNIRYLFARLKFGWNIEKYAEWISITCAINFIGNVT